MSKHLLTLTKTDRDILDSYKPVIDGLSQYLGNGYELILYSLEDPKHSVIKIINGHYTGRTEGSPITDPALTMLNNIKQKKSRRLCLTLIKKTGKS